ncbi:type VI secretion system tip protein TssI/VgrG [Hahella sp. SMD15-11]|uniref:Type VI secretion system tip protein TssI/VgrG n=1 Tax=Thermohahella caldifontis TaxID=3142973 RepID=A0AB39UUQ3_9GAMM
MSRYAQVSCRIAQERDVWQVEHWQGREGLDTPFSFTITLVSRQGAADPDWIDRDACLTLTGPLGSRHVHGLIVGQRTQMEDRGLKTVVIELAPCTDLLRHRVRRRIFEKATVEEIATRIWKEAGLPPGDLRFDLRDSLRRPDMTVQFDESEWDFLTRLFAEQGLHYHFVHHAHRHELVVSDHQAVFRLPDPLRRKVSVRDDARMTPEPVLYDWQETWCATPARVTVRQYDLWRPDRFDVAEAGEDDGTHWRVFGYAGIHPPAAQRARRIHARFRADAERARAFSQRVDLSPGEWVDVAHAGAPAGRYLIVALHHEGTQDSVREERALEGSESVQQIELLPPGLDWAAPLPPPRPVAPAQTALVMGLEEDRVHTDELGRVRLRFHWDDDPGRSAWVRVLTPFAGPRQGLWALPRVGQEVIVRFVEGDPDHPVVTGALYNGVNGLPWQGDDTRYRTGLRTRTVGEGASHVVQFDDTPGKEQIFLQSAGDMDLRIAGDQVETLDGHDRQRISGHSQTQVSGDVIQAIGGDLRGQSRTTLALGASADHSLKSGGNIRLGGSTQINAWAGQQMVIESCSQIVLNGGGSTLTITPGAIILNAPAVGFGGGGGAAGGRVAAQAAQVQGVGLKRQDSTAAQGTGQQSRTGQLVMGGADDGTDAGTTSGGKAEHTKPAAGAAAPRKPDPADDGDTNALVQVTEELDTLIYVPGLPDESGSHTEPVLAALPKDVADLLEEEARRLDDLLRKALDAFRKGNEAARAQALSELDATIKPLFDTGKIAPITEVWGGWGRKFTYVRSDVLRNHIRRYKLDVDVRNGRKFSHPDGRLDPAKLRKALTEGVRKKVSELSQGSVKFEYKADLVERKTVALTKMQLLINAEANHDPFGTRTWNASAAAQLVRYAYGAGLALTANPREGFSLKMDGFVSLTWAEGKATLEGYLPNESGQPVELNLPTKQGTPKPLRLGTYRVLAKISASGYAGSKLQLTADAACTLEQGRLMLRGLSSEEARELRRKDKFFTPAKAEINGFAGISAGIECMGSLQWDNPEIQKPGKPDSGWCDLAALGLEGNASVGAGVTAGFYVSYEEGKFRIRAKAGVVWGVGAGGDIGATVDTSQILTLAQYVYHQLKDNDYNYLTYIQPMAFEMLYSGIAIQIITGRPVQTIISIGYRRLSQLFNRVMQEHESGMRLAKAIVKGEQDDWLSSAVPELKGIMLWQLTNTNIASYFDPETYAALDGGWPKVNEIREEAVIKVLSYTQSQSEWREILEHCSQNGQKTDPLVAENRIAEFLDGCQRIRYDMFTRLIREKPVPGAVRRLAL